MMSRSICTIFTCLALSTQFVKAEQLSTHHFTGQAIAIASHPPFDVPLAVGFPLSGRFVYERLDLSSGPIPPFGIYNQNQPQGLLLNISGLTFSQDEYRVEVLNDTPAGEDVIIIAGTNNEVQVNGSTLNGKIELRFRNLTGTAFNSIALPDRLKLPDFDEISGTLSSTDPHGILAYEIHTLKPTPAPSALCLGLMGLSSLGLWHWRRRRQCS